MKYAFILALFTALHCEAQVGRVRSDEMHRNVLSALMQPQQSPEQTVMKTTAVTRQRVIAQSVRDNTAGSVIDSFDLAYTGSRGSTYDYNQMFYSYDYPYNTSPMFNFLGVFTKPQVLYDTCLHWTVSPFTNVYGMYEMMYGTYDTTRLKEFVDLFADSATNKNMHYVNTFNAAKNIATGSWYMLNMGQDDSAFRQYFAYNSANKLTQDSIYEYHLGAWHLVAKTGYTYDASNNLTRIDQFSNTADTSLTQPLIEQLKYVNTYDASNRLLTVLTSLYDGTALTDYVKDTFAYTGANGFHTSWKEHQWDAINNYWAPIYYMQKHLNSGALPDTVNSFGFDSLANAWTPSARDVISYNSMHNPVTVQDYQYSWTSFPASPNYTTTYYYESYLDATSVQPDKAVAQQGNVYPNPATDLLTVSELDAELGTGVVATFTDMNGRVVIRQSGHYYSGMQLGIGELVPGMYVLYIADADGRTLYSGKMIKK